MLNIRLPYRAQTSVKLALLASSLLLLSPLLLSPKASHASTPSATTEDIIIRSLSGVYLAGRAAGLNRDMAAAADLYARALNIDPANPLLIERTFLFSLSSGHYQRADKLAPRVAIIAPDHRLARQVMGISAFLQGKYSNARQEFRRMEFSPISELSSSLAIAWAYGAQKKSKEAQETLDRLSSNQAFFGFQSYHGALIADYLGETKKADRLYRDSLTNAPGSARVVEAYGNFLIRQSRKDEARKLYENFLATGANAIIEKAQADLAAGGKIAPLIATPAQGLAESLFGLASALTDEQSLELSLIYAQMAVAIEPDFVVARTLLGDIHADLDQKEQALADYDAVPNTSPLKPAAEIQAAVTLHELNRKDEAIARLDALIKADPRNYDAYLTKGNLLRFAEDYAKANKAYTSALALIAKPEARHWALYYSRAITYERQKQWPKAEADFRKAMSLDEDQPLVLNYLGYSFVERGENLDEAMQLIRRAVELRPNDGYIVDSLGWAHYQLGEYIEAVKHLERAVELKPSDPLINDHLGDAYWQAGRRTEARFQWQHAKDSDPDAELLATIEEKLKNGLTKKTDTTSVNSTVN